VVSSYCSQFTIHCSNYIVKPFTAEIFKEKVEKIFSSLKKEEMSSFFFSPDYTPKLPKDLK